LQPVLFHRDPIRNAIAPVAAEIMPGRPPVKAMTTGMQNDALVPRGNDGGSWQQHRPAREGSGQTGLKAGGLSKGFAIHPRLLLFNSESSPVS
jgi:hypothetical protein